MIIYSERNIAKIVEDFWGQYGGVSSIFAFEGEMGSGKTTFISALVRQLGYHKPTSSPTYSLVNEYIWQDSVGKWKTVYHFDLFRLKNSQELYGIGFDDYLMNPEAIVLIEWPQLAWEEIKEDAVLVRLGKVNEDHRSLEVLVDL